MLFYFWFDFRLFPILLSSCPFCRHTRHMILTRYFNLYGVISNSTWTTSARIVLDYIECTTGSPLSPFTPLSPSSPTGPLGPGDPGLPTAPSFPAAPYNVDLSTGWQSNILSRIKPYFLDDLAARQYQRTREAPKKTGCVWTSLLIRRFDLTWSPGWPFAPNDPLIPGSPLAPARPSLPGLPSSPEAPWKWIWNCLARKRTNRQRCLQESHIFLR